MENAQLTRFIERYLDSNMQPSEFKWFEKELDGNLWLQEELDLRRKTNEYAGNSDAIDFRQKLMKVEDNHRSRGPISKAVSSKPAYYAAVILGIIIISGIFIIRDLSDNTEKLITENTIYSPPMNPRSATLVNSQLYMTALDLYKQQDFEQAVIWFEKILDAETTEGAEYNYMFGFSNMKIERYGPAINSFTKVIDHSDNMYLNDAQWYLAVCYYRTNDKAKLIPLLETIASSESIHKKPARKLLRNTR